MDSVFKKYKIWILLVLVTPLLLTILQFPKTNPLQGVEELKAEEKLSWTEGTAQKYYENLWVRSSVVHPIGVKLRNQMDFSFFKKINVHNTYYNDGIFYRFYNDFQTDNTLFQGEKVLNKKFEQYKELYRLLKKRNKTLLFILTPEKHHVYYKQVPEINRAKNSDSSNYRYFINKFTETGLPFINFDSYFIENNLKKPYRLMAETGIHWTNYGAAVALDSIVKYLSIEQNTQYQNLEYKLGKPVKLNWMDNDLLTTSNFPIKPKAGPLADIYVTNADAKGKKIPAVLIGDSYFHAILWTQMKDAVFESNTYFYYYYNTEYDYFGNAHTIELKRLKKQVDEAECIIIESSPMNTENFGFGAIEKMLQILRAEEK